MAIWKVKSQTAVTVELLGRLPQRDCGRMAEELKTGPPAKTVHVAGQCPGILREHLIPFQECPFLAPINLASLLESLAQAPSEAFREVVIIIALGLEETPLLAARNHPLSSPYSPSQRKNATWLFQAAQARPTLSI